jgi:hypothetical protein
MKALLSQIGSVFRFSAQTTTIQPVPEWSLLGRLRQVRAEFRCMRAALWLFFIHHMTEYVILQVIIDDNRGIFCQSNNYCPYFTTTIPFSPSVR